MELKEAPLLLQSNICSSFLMYRCGVESTPISSGAETTQSPFLMYRCGVERLTGTVLLHVPKIVPNVPLWSWKSREAPARAILPIWFLMYRCGVESSELVNCFHQPPGFLMYRCGVERGRRRPGVTSFVPNVPLWSWKLQGFLSRFKEKVSS